MVDKYKHPAIWIMMILLFVCLLGEIDPGFSQNRLEVESTDILWINSYDRDNEWTRSIEESFIQTISKSGIQPNYYFEYMSTKKFSSDQYFKELKDLLHEKYKDMDIDYIITTDDDAAVFISENLQHITQRQIPVIYSGINKTYTFPSNFYGVKENSDVIKTIELIRQIQGPTTKILAITDKTRSSDSIIKENDLKQREVTDSNFILFQENEPQKMIQRLKQKDYQAVIFLLFNKDQVGNAYTYRQGFELFKDQIQTPVYSTWNFYFDDGLLGGVIVTGEEQGKKSAEILMSLHVGDLTLPHQTDAENQILLNFPVLKAFGIDAHSLPKEAILLNVPENYFTKNKTILLVSFAIVCLLLVVIYWLVVAIRKKVDQLQKANERLQEVKNLETIWNVTVSLSHELNTDVGNALTLLSFLKKEIGDFEEDFKEDRVSKQKMQAFLTDVMEIEKQIHLNLYKSVKYIGNIKEKSKKFTNRVVEDFMIDEEVHFVKDLYSDEIKSSGVLFDFKGSEGSRFTGSVEDFREILITLVDNSLIHGFDQNKFGGGPDHPKQITLRIKNSGDKMEMVYKDSGVGIEPERLNYIFDPLYKGDLTEFGEGMGLFRLKQIVTLEYDGSVVCQSLPNEGLEFKIEMNKRGGRE